MQLLRQNRNEPSKARLLEITEGTKLLSPPTLPWEVGNGLSALFKRRRIDLDQAKAALDAFREIPVRLGDVELERAVEIAKTEDIYAYDAYVLECARTYRSPLLSLDGPQRRIAEKGGEIRIKRRDGSEFTVRPVPSRGSPLNVAGVDTGVTRDDIIAAIRESRERESGRRSS